MANHTTGAQRYNKRLFKIFEEAKILKAKHAPLHAVIDALNRIDALACISAEDNDNGEAEQLEKDYNFVLKFIHDNFKE